MLYHRALSFAFPYALAWFRTHTIDLPVHSTNHLLVQVFIFIIFFLFHLHFLPNTLLEIQTFVSQGKWEKRLSWRKGNDREDLKKNPSWCWEEREKHKLIMTAKLWLTCKSTVKKRQMFLNTLVINHIGTSFFFCLFRLNANKHVISFIVTQLASTLFIRG